MPFAVLASILLLGIVHGLNPSHGWPIATLYSLRSKRPIVSGFMSSSIIAGAHLVSSIIIVLAYILLSNLIEVPQIYLRYGVAVGLGILAIIFWKEKSEDYVQTQHGHLHNQGFSLEYDTRHEHLHWHKNVGYHSHAHIHQIRESPNLKSIVVFALILGFAHEEEFVILAVAAGGGGDPLTVMIAYAGSVAIALIGITTLSIKVYKHLQNKLIYYSKYLPKISAIAIAFMSIGFAIGIL
jgi:nickel/cobalt transporter (NicO) family protein